MAKTATFAGVTLKVDVRGLDALYKETAKRGVTLAGAKAAMRKLKTAAKAAAPRRKGKGGGSLRKAQGVLARKGTKSGSTSSFAVQGAMKKFDREIVVEGRKKARRVVPAFYDHLVQLGVRPHRIGKGESLGRDATSRRKAVARTAQATGGKHPGTQPNPYRKRAWENVKDEAARRAVAAMGDALQKEIAKQHRRTMQKLSGLK